ncbi:uncharacterized protein LOC135347129 isoform X3 [Halichondria panicea]|uniref:uncharacterized protein LOC135347129 isoform X3 n=1 Tax=Halichondria panicea TaxID=6063 RepID=UPI00312B7810
MERDHQSVGTALRDTLGTTRESVKMWTSVRWSRCALVVPTVRILPGHMTVKDSEDDRRELLSGRTDPTAAGRTTASLVS